MTDKVTVIGKYRIFYWKAETPTGVSGWIVRHEDDRSPKSKHYTKREAVIAAKRFTQIDEGKAEVLPWNVQ